MPMRRIRPSCCARAASGQAGRAAKRGYEFSSSDIACHVTLGLGVIHATGG
jgi:hypothetical protein